MRHLLVGGCRGIGAFIPLIFHGNQQNFVQGNVMNPEQQIQTHSEPAEERPASTAQNQNRRRHRRGRSRHKRGGRAQRPEQRGEQTEREHEAHDAPEQFHAEETQAHTHAHAESHAHHGKRSRTIRGAIEQVEQIRRELQKVLEEMNEVLQTLHQAEREKDAAEDEIEMLAESLHLLKRDSAGQRNQPYRSAPSPRSAGSTSEKGSEPEVSPEEH